MAIGGAFGGRSGSIYNASGIFGINFITYWNCDKIALAQYDAKYVSPQDVPELYDLVGKLCQNAKIPMPKLYVIPTDVLMLLQLAVM